VVAGLEKRLAGDAAYSEACSAELLLFFDARDVQSELRRADCGDVATRACADNYKIVLCAIHCAGHCSTRLASSLL
jgi:hypothetical protein